MADASHAHSHSHSPQGSPLDPADPTMQPVLAPYVARLQTMVKPKRYAHCVRVSQLAQAIAYANHFSQKDADAALLAGFLHDAARDLSTTDMFSLVAPQTELERANPLMLHGQAGRVLATQWGVDDPQVLAAIAGHVFGVPLEQPVGMAVYIADISELARNVNHDIRSLAMVDLAEAYRQAVVSKVQYLQGKGKPVHPTTLALYNMLQDDTPHDIAQDAVQYAVQDNASSAPSNATETPQATPSNPSAISSASARRLDPSGGS